MLRASLVVGCVFLVSLAHGQTLTRPSGGFVHDVTSTVTRGDRVRIDQICRNVKGRSDGEIMVAVVRTTKGQNARQYATRIFNRWGIGNRFTNRGVLVFAAMNDRKAEIVLGDGIDSPNDEAIAREIMSDFMIPEFKRGKPSKGILAAVEQCATKFFRQGDARASTTEPAPAPHRANPPTNVTVGPSSSVAVRKPHESSRVEPVFPSEPGVPAVAETADDFSFEEEEVAVEQHVAHGAIDANALVRPPMQRRRPAGGGRSLLAILLGGTATLGGTGLGYHLLTARRKPRKCERCQQPMVLLDEESDDAHLNQKERLEERIGSVDYDIWSCSACSHVLKVRYGAFFTRYSKCPHCRARTKSSTSRTISHATTYSTGLKEVEETCEHCDFHRVRQHVIPRIQPTSSSSASGSSSGGGGGGGGTSSGGGASGSW